MQTTTIFRMAVKNTLWAMRLPLSTFERLSGQHENEAWPPALMFEGFEATAKQFAGAVLRDDTLLEEGRIQRAKLAELQRAAQLEAQAEAKRAQADQQLQQRLDAAERERARSEKQDEAREAAIERRKREDKAKVEADARRAEQAGAEVDKAREERVAKLDRQARLAAADAETAALTKQQQALAASERVVALADAVETKKAQRKNN